MQQLPSQGQARTPGAHPPANSPGGGPGERKSSSLHTGQAWGWSVSSSTTTASSSTSSSSLAGGGAEDPSPATPVRLSQRETKLGPRAPKKVGPPSADTRWIGRMFGPAWMQPGVEARARAGEACDLPLADSMQWLAGILDDPQVPVADAAVCAALVARRHDTHADGEPWWVLVDAIVAASLRAPGTSRLDKAAAMLVGLCRAQEKRRACADASASEAVLPRMDTRLFLAARLAAPGLPAADLERHVREGHGQRLAEAVTRALRLASPPRAGDDGKASRPLLLPSIGQLFDACPGDLGLWCLARGVEARLQAQAPASASQVPALDPPAPEFGDWPLPLALGVPLAPLARADDPARLVTQAMTFNAIHKVAHDMDGQTDAILEALRVRLLTEGRDWPAPLLMAAACGLATVCLSRESEDEDGEVRPDLLDTDLDMLLAMPQVADLPHAAHQAIAQGYALAQDPLDWLARQQAGRGPVLDDEALCQLLAAALAVRGTVAGAFLSHELSDAELAQARPRVAIPTIGAMLWYGSPNMDIAAAAFAEAGTQLAGYLKALAGTVDRLSARLRQLEGKAGRADIQARHERAMGELAEARLLWIPSVYRDFTSRLHQRWTELGPGWVDAERRHHASEARKAAATLRRQSRMWQDEAKAGLRGRCDHLPGVLEECARQLEGLAAEILKGLGPEAAPSPPGEQAFERALREQPAFDRLLRADPAEAHRIRQAVLGLLRTHDALSAQALTPHRAAGLLRAADLQLALQEAQVAAGVIARMCGPAGMSEACMETLVSTALALAGQDREGKDGKDGKEARVGKEAVTGPGRAVGLLGGIWSALQVGHADAEVVATVFLSIIARQLAHQARPQLRMDLVSGVTAYLLADAGPGWLGLFLRELMASPRPLAGPPREGAAAKAELEARQHDFLAVALALHGHHRGLSDNDWHLLLGHLQEARLDDASTYAMTQALLLGAAGGRLDRIPVALAQVVRQLAVRPGSMVAPGRLVRIAFECLERERAGVAGVPADKAWPPRQVFEDLLLGVTRTPGPAARLVALVTLGLQHTPEGLQAVRQWLLDAVAAIDATLVVAELDATSPQSRVRAAVQRDEAQAQVAAFGTGHAFALAMDRTPALKADAVREALTLPARSGVQPAMQEALWRGGRQALEAIAAGRDLGSLAGMPPEDPEGSKSRRTAGGRDRQDPKDPGYGEKRKTRGTGKPAAGGPGEGQPPALQDGAPVPPTVLEDKEAARLQAQFAQSLQAFAAALADPGARLPLSAPREALARWMQAQVGGERSWQGLADTGVAPVASRHPADAEGIGWQLEQVFRQFAFFVDVQVLAWHRAGADLSAMVQQLDRELQRWHDLAPHHARRIRPMLVRARNLLESQSRHPKPRRAPLEEGRGSGETKATVETKAGLPARSPTPSASDGVDDGFGDMDDDTRLALAMSLAEEPSPGPMDRLDPMDPWDA